MFRWLYTMAIAHSAKKYAHRYDKDNLEIHSGQLKYLDRDLFKKIPAKCSDCKEETTYKIWIEKITGLGSYATSRRELVYWIKCTTCSDAFEILEEDFSKMKPIIKLNEKLKTNKIDQRSFEDKLEKYTKKLAVKQKVI